LLLFVCLFVFLLFKQVKISVRNYIKTRNNARTQAVMQPFKISR